MSETIPTREGVLGTETPKTPPAQSETTTMGRAFQELAQKLGVESGKNVATALKERGAIAGDDIGERASASVINFPLERKRTKDDQRRLGSEVGLSAGQFIGEHVQNNMKKVLGGTIPTMEGEKQPPTTERIRDLTAPPEKDQAPQSLETQQRISEIVTAIDELEKKGGNEKEIAALEAELQKIYSEQNSPQPNEQAIEAGGAIAPVSEPSPIGNAELTPAAEPTLSQIEEEMAVLRQKKEEARAQIRDHSQSSITEPLKAIHEINARIKHLEGKSIRATIQNMPIEEVAERRVWALEQLKDHNVNDKTEATAILVFTNERLNEGKYEKKSQLTIDEQQQRKINKKIQKAATPDVATHLKAVGMNETEEVVTKNEPVTQTTEVSQKENAGEPKQPATAEEAPAPVKQEGAYEIVMKKIAAEDPARAERLLNAIGATPEQRERIEKLFGATQAFEEKTNAIEKEKDPWVVERALKIGGWYRTVPLKKKLIASAFLIGGASALAASGGAGAAMIATAAFTGSAFQRILGGLAVASAIEGVLTRRSIARNEEEERILGMRMNVILGALAGTGVFLGGKLLGDYLSSGGEQASEVPPPKETPVEPLKGSLETSPQTEYAEKVESVREVLKSEALVQQPYTVQEGDKLWNILKEKLPAVQSLAGEEAKQSNAIANIIEEIKKDPASFGITSGNVDNLHSGDVLNMEKIHSVLENTKISVGGAETTILERAEGLSDTEVSTIEANNEKLAEWQAEHPGEQLTTETTDKILNESSGVETPSENFDNVRKDMETMEAVSMKTEQIFRADIQTMFGSKGLFGYGFLGTNGERSVDWLDLKDRTVDEVMTKKFEGEVLGEEGGVTKFGIDSFSAVDKIKGYMNMLIERTGLTPEKTESVDHFVHRAIRSIASK